MTQIDIAHLKQWTGRSESAQDLIAAGTAHALAATLDRDERLADGDALPPLWHWIYFWSVSPASGLGPDGHPRRGGFLPPVPLPRRMWAGGRLRFDAPLALGQPAEKTSTILDVNVKQGSSGTLAFVTVAHAIAQDGRTCVYEEHDIVYRDVARDAANAANAGNAGRAGNSNAPAAAPVAGKPAPTDAHWTRTIEPDPVLLFRYSALTFNGHRIHYDRSYATGVEGYAGLIVHGPLIATLLVDLVRRQLPDRTLRSFSFRAVSPLFDIERFSLNGRLSDDGQTVTLWAANARGELAMQAEAVLA